MDRSTTLSLSLESDYMCEGEEVEGAEEETRNRPVEGTTTMLRSPSRALSRALCFLRCDRGFDLFRESGLRADGTAAQLRTIPTSIHADSRFYVLLPLYRRS